MRYAKKRPAIPKGVSDAVLKEYSHLCAICAEKDPQLHHLDENRENNEPLNLIPLCPNCHLTDQHNPTSQRPAVLLALFRRCKDPFVLLPQFMPIFERMRFLYSDFGSEAHDKLWDWVIDFSDFIEALEMGGYYAKKIVSLLTPPPSVGIAYSRSDPEGLLRYDAWTQERNREYVIILTRARPQVEKLTIELLRYQGWTLPEKLSKRRDG
jgi:hypothetical protein